MVEEALGQSPARRGRPGYDQETVLRRAIQLFIAQGYDATSMHDLARELGLTKSAIYHHVPGKEALLAAALDEALDELSSAIRAPWARRPAPPSTGSVAPSRRGPRARRAPARGHAAAPGARQQRRSRWRPWSAAAALDEQLASLVRAAVEEGSVRGDIAPEVISRLLFGMVNSLVEWYHPDGPVHADDLARSVAGLAFDGLLRRGSAR